MFFFCVLLFAFLVLVVLVFWCWCFWLFGFGFLASDDDRINCVDALRGISANISNRQFNESPRVPKEADACHSCATSQTSLMHH